MTNLKTSSSGYQHIEMIIDIEIPCWNLLELLYKLGLATHLNELDGYYHEREMMSAWTRIWQERHPQ